jgi:hypothetical protein
LRSNTKLFYYWNKESGQFVKEKREKYLKWISSKTHSTGQGLERNKKN